MDSFGTPPSIDQILHSIYRPANPTEGTLHVLSTRDANGNWIPVETLIRQSESEFVGYLRMNNDQLQAALDNGTISPADYQRVRSLKDSGFDLATAYENVFRSLAGEGPIDPPGGPVNPNTPTSGGGLQRNIGLFVNEVGPLTLAGAGLATFVPPEYLAVANGAGWVVRGLATLPIAIAPETFAPDTQAGRTLRGISAGTFVGNAGYHLWATGNGQGYPYNPLFSISDVTLGSRDLNSALTGTPATSQPFDKYTGLAAANIANASLLPIYSINAGVEAWVPNLLFGGATAYLTGRTIQADVAAANGTPITGGNNTDVRIAQGLLSAGLISFGLHYLGDVALPQFNAEPEGEGLDNEARSSRPLSDGTDVSVDLTDQLLRQGLNDPSLPIPNRPLTVDEFIRLYGQYPE